MDNEFDSKKHAMFYRNKIKSYNGHEIVYPITSLPSIIIHDSKISTFIYKIFAVTKYNSQRIFTKKYPQNLFGFHLKLLLLRPSITVNFVLFFIRYSIQKIHATNNSIKKLCVI